MPIRSRLGVGSRLSLSADALPSFRATQDFDRPGGALTQSAAYQGAEPSLDHQMDEPMHDAIDDAILVSHAKATTKILSISDEADLVAGRDHDDAHRRPSTSSALDCEDSEWRGSTDMTPEEERILLDIVANRISSISRDTAPAPRISGSSVGRQEPGEREKALLTQIKELTRQLEKEKDRKKEEAKAALATPPEQRDQLVICTHLLPYKLHKGTDGTLRIGRPSSKLAAYENLTKLDVTWVGFLAEHVEPKDEKIVREKLFELNCIPVFLRDKSVREAAEGMSAEVRGQKPSSRLPQLAPPSRRERTSTEPHAYSVKGQQ